MNISTKEKGITLIALVVTIIILIILATISISVAVNSGLIDTSKRGKAQYLNEDAEWAATEANIVAYVKEEIDGNKEGTGGDSSEVINFTIDGKPAVAKKGWDWEDWIRSEKPESFKHFKICYEGKLGYCVADTCNNDYARGRRWRSCSSDRRYT